MRIADICHNYFNPLAQSDAYDHPFSHKKTVAALKIASYALLWFPAFFGIAYGVAQLIHCFKKKKESTAGSLAERSSLVAENALSKSCSSTDSDSTAETEQNKIPIPESESSSKDSDSDLDLINKMEDLESKLLKLKKAEEKELLQRQKAALMKPLHGIKKLLFATFRQQWNLDEIRKEMGIDDYPENLVECKVAIAKIAGNFRAFSNLLFTKDRRYFNNRVVEFALLDEHLIQKSVDQKYVIREMILHILQGKSCNEYYFHIEDLNPQRKESEIRNMKLTLYPNGNNPWRVMVDEIGQYIFDLFGVDLKERHELDLIRMSLAPIHKNLQCLHEMVFPKGYLKDIQIAYSIVSFGKSERSQLESVVKELMINHILAGKPCKMIYWDCNFKEPENVTLTLYPNGNNPEGMILEIQGNMAHLFNWQAEENDFDEQFEALGSDDKLLEQTFKNVQELFSMFYPEGFDSSIKVTYAICNSPIDDATVRKRMIQHVLEGKSCSPRYLSCHDESKGELLITFYPQGDNPKYLARKLSNKIFQVFKYKIDVSVYDNTIEIILGDELIALTPQQLDLIISQVRNVHKRVYPAGFDEDVEVKYALSTNTIEPLDEITIKEQMIRHILSGNSCDVPFWEIYEEEFESMNLIFYPEGDNPVSLVQEIEAYIYQIFQFRSTRGVVYAKISTQSDNDSFVVPTTQIIDPILKNIQHLHKRLFPEGFFNMTQINYELALEASDGKKFDEVMIRQIMVDHILSGKSCEIGYWDVNFTDLDEVTFTLYPDGDNPEDYGF